MTKAAVRVLLVDDDEDEYVIVGDLLRATWTENYDLKWAPTYEQGLEQIRGGNCDVCLVDYRLGKRSGLDLLAEVTVLASHPQVILLTGEGDRGVDVTATRAGAADYLIKGDLTAAQLERSIRYAVERGRCLKALRDATELAHSMNLAKSAFVAAMSHEIRTPMNAVLGMTEMLGETPLSSEQRQYVEVIQRAGSGLLELINDILDLSKIEAGHLQLERVEFDLEDVMDHAIELIAVKARAKGIMLLLHLFPGVATARIGDPTRLRQILINLLGNAVKFTAAGEVVLTVRNDESGKCGIVDFAVSDTGVGIPSDKLESIFDDFTQAEASTTRKYGGTGLGLGISRRLVEAMGGRLTAGSSPGQGSTFRFTANFDPAPEDTRRVRVAPSSFRGKRVFLASDNDTSCFILREALQAWGLGVDACRLPAERLAAEPPYSLIIIDVCTPGTGAFEAVAEIRQVAGSPPVVMLASDTRLDDTAHRIKAGLSGYAVKPVGRAGLLRLVCEALAPGERLESPPAARLDRREIEPVKPARILVAEDSQDNRLLVKVYLQTRPYQLTFEENGKAALDRFAGSDFDLILMDVQMPVMDGLAATRAIRALERKCGRPSTPIIALTADASLQDVERSGNAGCNAHLSKPISKPELLSAIEKYRRQLAPAGIA